MEKEKDMVGTAEAKQPDYKTALYTCLKCGETKEWAAFCKDKREDCKIIHTCRKCADAAAKAKKLKKIADGVTFENFPATQVCTRCGVEKPRSEFFVRLLNDNGINHHCKDCMRADVLHTPEVLAERATYANKRRKADPRRTMLVKAKQRAKEKGLEFSLTLSDIYIPKTCPILNVPLEPGTYKDGGKCSPSLDRINTKYGYIPGNISVVSRRGNTIKNDATIEELESVIKYIQSFDNIPVKATCEGNKKFYEDERFVRFKTRELVREHKMMSKDGLISKNELKAKFKERYKTDPLRSMYVSAKSRAKQFGIPFTIVLEDLYMPKACPILGTVFELGVGMHRPESPSLDKVKPELGYVPGNVAIISRRANIIKNNSTVDEIKSVIAYMKSFSNVNLGQTTTEVRIFEPIDSKPNNPKVNRLYSFPNSGDENKGITQKESL